MYLNTRAGTDARHARAGKDAGLFSEDGVLLASIDSFQAKGAFNNLKYSPLGQNRELEANNTYALTITFTEIKVEDGYLFSQLMAAVADGESPVFTVDGVIMGRNGSQERITYRECIFSGDNDIQNVSSGDVIKSSFSLFCNGKVERRSALTI